ncbi:hypothetical protein GCM10023322_09040 [Rugosimonospora acidiphila]|uniref:Uncharacterized protein n=1 Tax=Rugosimonospora acidiphila TaxID=556531 RepID=A0ABP9RM76_9ACTN
MATFRPSGSGARVAAWAGPATAGNPAVAAITVPSTRAVAMVGPTIAARARRRRAADVGDNSTPRFDGWASGVNIHRLGAENLLTWFIAL